MAMTLGRHPATAAAWQRLPEAVQPEILVGLWWASAKGGPGILRTSMSLDSLGISALLSASRVFDGTKAVLCHRRDAAEIPLAAHGAEYACEFAGERLTAKKVRLRLKASAEKIEFSASAEDDSRVVVTA